MRAESEPNPDDLEIEAALEARLIRNHSSRTRASERTLETILEQTAAMHRHLCPRQVLGARMALLAGRALRLELPREDKRLLALVETDGCFADGVSLASGCWMGRRTMRLVDHGKIAASFLDTLTGAGVRIAPVGEARHLARERAAPGQGKWEAYLEGYKIIPDEELFRVQPVRLRTSLAELLSSPGKRAVCETCGEEIINGREIIREASIFCRACAGEPYVDVIM